MSAEKKTVFFLVRHGQTEANANDRICGDIDSPLTEEGLRQIAGLAQSMRGIEFDVAYTSSLLRARQTCDAILAGRALEPVVLPALREQDFGDWEGMSYKTAMEDDPDAFASFRVDPVRARAPGGETLLEFVNRVQGAIFDEILVRHRGRRILVVAHGGTVRAALYLLLKIEINQNFFLFDIQNATLSIVRYGEGGGRLIGMGLMDATHLKI